PVREALIDLAAQGMVRFERNRGVRVLQTSIHDLEEIVTLRLLLEVPATYRATQQMTNATLRLLHRELAAMERAARTGDQQALVDADRQFHNAILEMSGNRRLAQYADHLRDLTLIRGYMTVGDQRTPLDIVEEHRAILAEIEDGNPRGA